MIQGGIIHVRRASLADAAGIGAVHTATWRSTYPGILPDSYLAAISPSRQAVHYARSIRAGVAVHVATAHGNVVGFVTADRARRRSLAEGEIETLYVLDDWRDQGIGRRLMRAAATALKTRGCGSVHVWVLRDNTSRWFYTRLGGTPVAEDTIQFAGRSVPQSAFAWDPIEKLLEARAEQ